MKRIPAALLRVRVRPAFPLVLLGVASDMSSSAAVSLDDVSCVLGVPRCVPGGAILCDRPVPSCATRRRLLVGARAPLGLSVPVGSGCAYASSRYRLSMMSIAADRFAA